MTNSSGVTVSSMPILGLSLPLLIHKPMTLSLIDSRLIRGCEHALTMSVVVAAYLQSLAEADKHRATHSFTDEDPIEGIKLCISST